MKLNRGKFTHHGQSIKGKETTEWRIWRDMKTRCNNPNCEGYERYGGRGIRVCDRWNSFPNFFEDMGIRPEGKTLDRINNNGNYEPNNCRWATLREQGANKRNNHYLTLNGRKQTIAQWCRELGFIRKTITSRINYGWSDERILTEPLRPWSKIRLKNRPTSLNS